MISQLSIKNFKGFRDFSTDGIKPITIIGGKNNVGKTNLLEAVFLTHDRTNPEMILRQYNWRGVPAVPSEPDHMWGPFFWNYEMDRLIQIGLRRGKVDELFTVKYLSEYTPKKFQPTNDSGVFLTDGISGTNWALELKGSIDGDIVFRGHLVAGPGTYAMSIEKPAPIPKSFFHTARGGGIPGEMATIYSKLEIEGDAQWIIEDLQLIEPDLKGLMVASLGAGIPMLYADVGMKKKLPIALMGDGISRFLSLISSMVNTKGGIILIDEFENGLHYSVLPKLWHALARAAKKYDCQIMVTSHSYECLNSAVKGLSGDLANLLGYIRLDQAGENILAKVYDYELLASSIEDNWEVR